MLHLRLQHAVLIPTVCPCVPWWQRFQQSQQACTISILPGSCQRCGWASPKKSLVGSFPHLALGAVFHLLLAWTALWLCLYLALYLVDPDPQASCFGLSKSDVCQAVCFICSLTLFSSIADQATSNNNVSHQLRACTRKINCKLAPFLFETILWKQEQSVLVYFVVTFYFPF